MNATESQENSVYHAVPPAGFVAYNYHLVTPKGEAVIRVREERVGVGGGGEAKPPAAMTERPAPRLTTLASKWK